jgi:hypothetical protein
MIGFQRIKVLNYLYSRYIGPIYQKFKMRTRYPCCKTANSLRNNQYNWRIAQVLRRSVYFVCLSRLRPFFWALACALMIKGPVGPPYTVDTLSPGL